MDVLRNGKACLQNVPRTGQSKNDRQIEIHNGYDVILPIKGFQQIIYDNGKHEIIEVKVQATNNSASSESPLYFVEANGWSITKS